MTTALQITVLLVLCIGIPLAFLAMIRAHARTDSHGYSTGETIQIELAHEDSEPVVRKFNPDGANVPPSGLHKPERAADLQAIGAEILHANL